jgi:hypothetical protein
MSETIVPPKAKKAPKKPADHLEPQAKKAQVSDVEGGKKVTWPDGFSVVILIEAINDFELLDEMSQMQSLGERGSVKLPSVLRRTLGDDQMPQVMDRLRDPQTKRVTIQAGVGFFQELFGALNPNG